MFGPIVQKIAQCINKEYDPEDTDVREREGEGGRGIFIIACFFFRNTETE